MIKLPTVCLSMVSGVIRQCMQVPLLKKNDPGTLKYQYMEQMDWKMHLQTNACIGTSITII